MTLTFLPISGSESVAPRIKMEIGVVMDAKSPTGFITDAGICQPASLNILPAIAPTIRGFVIMFRNIFLTSTFEPALLSKREKMITAPILYIGTIVAITSDASAP